MKRILTAAVLALISIAAAAQQFPAKPISLVVTFAAGGAMDLTARSMAAVMSESFGRVIVENRTGGGGLIGTDHVARAAPDGHTLLMFADVRDRARGSTPSSTTIRSRTSRRSPTHPRHSHHRCASVGEGEYAERADRACQARAGQAHLRFTGNGHAPAPRGRAVQAAGGRPRHPARSLSRRRPADYRPGRRADPARPDRPAAHAAAHQGRQAEGVRGHRAQALAVAAGRADGRGGRAAGLRDRAMVRPRWPPPARRSR